MARPNDHNPQPIINDYAPIAVAYRYFFLTPVANGVAYLNTTYPGWHKRIDLNTFNMRHTNADVLAQVHNADVRETVEYREWSFNSLHAHGFFLPSERYNDYDSLTLCWRIAIDKLNGGNHK